MMEDVVIKVNGSKIFDKDSITKNHRNSHGPLTEEDLLAMDFMTIMKMRANEPIPLQ